MAPGSCHESRRNVRCNQTAEDNHAGAEDSLLSSRQCWVLSLWLHFGVRLNTWPPVWRQYQAPGFFGSARRQGRM